jgi:hypothetical protein
MDSVYIRLDCDNVGDKIECALYNEKPEIAQNISNKIKKNIKLVVKKFKSEFNSELLLVGSDDLLLKIELKYFDIEKIEKIKFEFQKNSGITLSIGIGKTILDSLVNLKIAKVSGKNRIEFNKNDFLKH